MRRVKKYKTKYKAREIETIQNESGCRESYIIGIFEVKGNTETKIGEYARNYSFLNTFFHFRKNRKDYALYSSEYTCTRVMELPSCRDLGGENPSEYGFCPVEFYVPKESKGNFGFVAGCVWGDDCSWKIEFLDLSRVEEGIVKRDSRFGYISLPDGISLKRAINMINYYEKDEEYNINIAIGETFDLNTGKAIGINDLNIGESDA